MNFVYQVRNCLSERCQEMFNYQFIVKKATLHLALSSKWIVKTWRKARKHRYPHTYPTNSKLQQMAFRNLILKSCHPFNSAFNNWRTFIRFWVNLPIFVIRIKCTINLSSCDGESKFKDIFWDANIVNLEFYHNISRIIPLF